MVENNNLYVLDTSAIFTFFENEQGADLVEKILRRAELKKAEMKKLYYPIEAHWNRNGHSLAAEILANKLTFLPDAP